MQLQKPKNHRLKLKWSFILLFTHNFVFSSTHPLPSDSLQHPFPFTTVLVLLTCSAHSWSFWVAKPKATSLYPSNCWLMTFLRGTCLSRGVRGHSDLLTEGKDKLSGGNWKGEGIVQHKLGLRLVLSRGVVFSPVSTEDHYEFQVFCGISWMDFANSCTRLLWHKEGEKESNATAGRGNNHSRQDVTAPHL